MPGGLQNSNTFNFTVRQQGYQHAQAAIELPSPCFAWVINITDCFDASTPCIQVECILAFSGRCGGNRVLPGSFCVSLASQIQLRLQAGDSEAKLFRRRPLRENSFIFHFIQLLSHLVFVLKRGDNCRIQNIHIVDCRWSLRHGSNFLDKFIIKI